MYLESFLVNDNNKFCKKMQIAEYSSTLFYGFILKIELLTYYNAFSWLVYNMQNIVKHSVTGLN